ncbi:hypothetical protein KC460_05205 [Candidatus Dependentiae bacterium]|nr:hypothetical protein [Candidatus Dependentiae bacterium]
MSLSAIIGATDSKQKKSSNNVNNSDINITKNTDGTWDLLSTPKDKQKEEKLQKTTTPSTTTSTTTSNENLKATTDKINNISQELFGNNNIINNTTKPKPDIKNIKNISTDNKNDSTKKRGRPKKVAFESNVNEKLNEKNLQNTSSSSFSWDDSLAADSKAFNANLNKEFNDTKQELTSRFNKRGALKKDVKWAMETLTQARRELSPEEKKKVQLANEINRYYESFPDLLGPNIHKGKKDVSKVPLNELIDEKANIKQILAQPQSLSLVEDIYVSAIEVAESLYMRRFFGTEHDFLNVNISGLSKMLRGNIDYVRPELTELAIEYSQLLSLGPTNRLLIKTGKMASDCHILNTSAKTNINDINNKYKNL